MPSKKQNLRKKRRIRYKRVDGCIGSSNLDDGVSVEGLSDNLVGVAEGIFSPCDDGFIESRVCMNDGVSAESLESISRGSRNTSPISDISSVLNMRGRPRKRKSNRGRPKKNNSNERNVQENISVNNIPDLMSIEILEIPFGPVLHTDNRIAIINGNVGVTRDFINQLWSNPDEWLAEDYIYSYQRYLASISEKRVIVLDPQYTSMVIHDGNIPYLAIENCYNYSPDYDILFMTICFTGHFAIVIYDRSDRNNQKCLFVDSLPERDRLFDITYPDFDIRRIDLIKRGICVLTPNLLEDEIQIKVLDRSEFTEQTDGINCGFFVCLYPEAYLFNDGCMIIPNLNINYERKRILWNISQLVLSNEIDYIGLFPQNQIVPQNEFVFSFNLNIFDDDHINNVINTYPILNIEPDPPLENLRRSERIRANRTNVVSNVINDTTVSYYEVSAHCGRAHKSFPCADVRAKHYVSYYDSGNFGDVVCTNCGALLLKSEINEMHRNKYKKITSSFCCRCGLVAIPPFNPHPQLLKDFTRGDSPNSLEFLKNHNIYNSLLAFASVYVGHRETTFDGGICYMLNGEFVRKISSMIAGNDGPSFSQLYILDANTAFEHRVNNCVYGGDRVNPITLRELDNLLRNVHPFANVYQNFHTQYLQKLRTEGPDSVSNFRLVLVEARDVPQNINDNLLHPRQVNLPTEESMFAVWTESDEPPYVKGICITDEEGRLLTFPPYHPLTDTLCYPLLFPIGEDGYHKKIPVNSNVNQDNESDNSDSDHSVAHTVQVSHRKFISTRDYIRYRLALKNNEDYHNIWNSGGGLSQKFVLDYAARIDSEVADYLRTKEMDLRATLPENALRFLAREAGLESTDKLGRVVMFRKYHPGTRPWFQDMFYDATTIMARTRKQGFASFMFTFTCNPRWPEIKRNLLRDNQLVVDRFDVLSRIYEDKLRMVHYLLDKKNILGKILGHGESREFQKRIGGPHLHRVYCTDTPATAENIENIIWALIPPEPNTTDNSGWANFIRKIRELLPQYQFHDCAAHCRDNNGRCKKRFPKPFSNFTILHDNKPAEYFRPSPENGGEVLKIKRGRSTIIYDNSRVVPYNPFILVKFQTHHNLEYAYGQSDNLKYALKYPFKGASFSYVKSTVNGLVDVDEPAQYARMLYRSPTEAYTRIMGYKYAFTSHRVIPLEIHLPNQQRQYFNRNTVDQVLANIQSGILSETKLTAYWNMWSNDPNNPVRNILFEQLPETYSFDKRGKFWKKRKISEKNKNRKPVLGRILPVTPRDPEKFALYILTKHFPGNPEHLLNVNGQICDSFADAARLRGLFDDNNVWERTLREATFSLNPSQIRQLFANILVFGGTERCIIDGAQLWELFRDHMYDRRCNDAERLRRMDRALAIIERYLLAQGRTLNEFGLPAPQNPLINDPNSALNDFFFPSHLNDDEMDEAIDTTALERANLNNEQYNFFIMLRDAALDLQSTNRLFYLSGDGGTGKTFLLNYILYQLRRLNLKVLPTASTGIAATKFYSGGMTVHSTFRLGINVEVGVIPPIQLDSYFGRRIIQADVLIIDEITMLNKIIFENVDLLCRTLIPEEWMFLSVVKSLYYQVIGNNHCL